MTIHGTELDPRGIVRYYYQYKIDGPKHYCKKPTTKRQNESSKTSRWDSRSCFEFARNIPIKNGIAYNSCLNSKLLNSTKTPAKINLQLL